jgi:hypothetical protein
MRSASLGVQFSSPSPMRAQVEHFTKGTPLSPSNYRFEVLDFGIAIAVDLLA